MKSEQERELPARPCAWSHGAAGPLYPSAQQLPGGAGWAGDRHLADITSLNAVAPLFPSSRGADPGFHPQPGCQGLPLTLTRPCLGKKAHSRSP